MTPKSLRWLLYGLFLSSSGALAIPPQTPISLDLEVGGVPLLHQSSTLTIKVVSSQAAPDTSVELILPEGITAEETRWNVDLEADVPHVFTTRWTVTTAVKNSALNARALRVTESGAVWGDMKSIPIYVSLNRASRGWLVDSVPVAIQVEDGDVQPLSEEPTAFSFSSPEAQEALEAPMPAVVPTPISSPAAEPRTSLAGTTTLTGRWSYLDRSGVQRNVDQQIIEIRRGDGSALNPRVYCYTAVDGTYSCSFPHPGTTLRVWVRSYTNFTPGPTRLGVFSGIEVSGGCGSDSIDCSYPVETAEVSCADGQTCNVGSYFIPAGEPWLGAHQMTQDLIRSWKRLFFDTFHPVGGNPGPGRITYPVPSGHGTHAHVGGIFDGWISIEPPSQQSGDITAHEYGHVVMSNLWFNFSPSWPTFDCPSPHMISELSGPGCALSEGFANFWAWYSNQFYDGDATETNDGGIFNWPGGAFTNLETRDNGTYASGDQVEGNVAAAFGDLYDTANDGPATGPADRLADGIQHIWHTIFSQSDSNLSQWWTAYWSTLGHPGCAARDVLRFNAVSYSTPSCTASSCSQATTLSCGSTDTRSNASAGSTSSISSYLCFGGPYPAPEYTYTFNAPSNTHVQISLTGLSSDLDLFVLRDLGVCPGSCTSYAALGGASNEIIKFGAASGHRYQIVVDGYQGAISNYSLQLTCDGPTFEDVPDSHPFFNEINALYNSGVTLGCSTSPRRYCPLGPVTRADMAVFIERGLQGRYFVPPTAAGLFADVSLSDFRAPWIEKFYHDGITQGCSLSPLQYCPSRIVTRAEMAVFLLRARHGASYSPPPAIGIFGDVPVTHWAASWIEQFYREGITNGCSANPRLYCPGDGVARQAMAAFLVRTFNLSLP